MKPSAEQFLLPSALQTYLNYRTLSMLFLGFAAGIPILLIFSTLGLWLQEAGIDRKTVTMFSWAALGYSFKFVWSPLIDSLPLPILSRLLGQRRSWLLLAQILIIIAITTMANINPLNPNNLILMAFGAVLLGFSSATQDIVIDSYRIEAAPENAAMQSAMSATYVAGYRLGMIVAGAGSLYLASWFGTSKEHYVYHAWQYTYWIMAAVMLIGITTTLLISEPEVNKAKSQRFSPLDNIRLLCIFVLSVAGLVATFQIIGDILPIVSDPILTFLLETIRLGSALIAALIIGYLAVKSKIANKTTVHQAFIEPLADFFKRYGKKAILLLALIAFYRISDIVAGVISNVFYADMGFSKNEIATAVKLVGVVFSIIGGFAGGILAQRFAIMRMMMIGAAASASTHLLFILLTHSGHSLSVLYTAVGLDNFTAGLASTVFVAFLSTLTNIRFSAVQYALFSSLMLLLPKTIGGYSGAIVDKIGYDNFFILTTLMGIPVLILVWLADKYLFQKSN